MMFLNHQLTQPSHYNEKRIKRLKNKMLNRKASICSERAILFTDIFKQYNNEPFVIKKAKAFAHTLDKMTLYVESDSLIFGNMASRNFAAPIYPEYSMQWIIDELDEFELRGGDVFSISEDVKQNLRDIAPFWLGKTHQDEVLRNMPELVLQAQRQKVLHFGGISMSGDGHVVLDYEQLLRDGINKTIHRIQKKISKTEDREKLLFYESALISLEAVLRWVKRYAKLIEEMACVESCEDRRQELTQMSKIANRVFQDRASSFYEALQAIYLIHILQMIESNGHSFCYGRFDQVMWPYYERDIKSGTLSKDHALELITHFFLMNNSCNKVRPYGHTKYSQGYPLYTNLVIGGLISDGVDGVNDLSYLCIEAMNTTALAEPNFSMRYHETTPQEIMELAVKLIATGNGMPSIFNDEVVVEAMRYININETDVFNYVPIGCVETGIPSKYNHRSTGMTYVNWGKLFELLMNDGRDPMSQIQLIKLTTPTSYAQLWENWNTLLAFYTQLAVDCDRVCDESLSVYDSDPLTSVFHDDCIERGKTLKNGGARYDVVSQSNTGVVVVANSLMSLKKLVFDEKRYTLTEIKNAITHNWEGEYKHIRHDCLQVAKFGNDIDEVDQICANVFESYLSLLPQYRTRCAHFMNEGVSCYTMSTSNITSYVPNGLNVGATPDGRYAYSPLNEGCSPYASTDKNGPTAVIASVAKLPNYKIAAGQLLNMRFTADSFKNESLFVAFLRACCKMGIFHNQFNVIDSEKLIKAMQSPQEYQDLFVRVAGYCAQFVSLMPQAQKAIIERTENYL